MLLTIAESTMTWPEAIATSVGAIAAAATLIAIFYFMLKS